MVPVYCNISEGRDQPLTTATFRTFPSDLAQPERWPGIECCVRPVQLYSSVNYFFSWKTQRPQSFLLIDACFTDGSKAEKWDPEKIQNVGMNETAFEAQYHRLHSARGVLRCLLEDQRGEDGGVEPPADCFEPGIGIPGT